jgi:hypothetical protein
MKRLVVAVSIGLLAGASAGCGGAPAPTTARGSPGLNPPSTAPAMQTGPATTAKERGR